jgi:competence protein ComEA
MLDRDPRRLAAWAAAAVFVALLSGWYLTRSRPVADAAPPPVTAAIDVEEPDAGGARVTVDVAGAVKRPGVYRLTVDQRVEDALKEAGGPTERADLSQLNRAAKLEDGRQILVPPRPSKANPTVAPAAGTAPAAASQPIDLNTATLEQLDTLDGVGPATAKKILDFRAEHGGFGSVDKREKTMSGNCRIVPYSRDYERRHG